MYSEKIKLIKIELIPDEAGELIPNKTEKVLIAKMMSIGQQEFYQSQAEGNKPELKFVISDYLDYGREEELEHNDITYKILRTYRKGLRELELTVYGGVNNG